MKISTTTDIVDYSLINNETGEVSSINVSQKVSNTYYSIKGLRTKITMNSFAEKQSLVCKSSLDLQIFWHMMQKTERNILLINQKETARLFGVSPDKINKFIKRLVDVEFLKKKQQGVYFVNPYIFKSPKTTNEIIEQLQEEWNNV